MRQCEGKRAAGYGRVRQKQVQICAVRTDHCVASGVGEFCSVGVIHLILLSNYLLNLPVTFIKQ